MPSPMPLKKPTTERPAPATGAVASSAAPRSAAKPRGSTIAMASSSTATSAPPTAMT